MKNFLGIALVLAVASIASAATVFVDCPNVQQAAPLPSPPGAVPTPGNLNSTPCTLATPSGTITDLSLTYKYSLTTSLSGGAGDFDHTTLNAALNFFNNGPVVHLANPPVSSSSVTLVINHAPTGAELLALAADGALNFNWLNFTGTVQSVSADFRWTITYTEPPTGGEIPEPGTFALLGAALVGMAVVARRRRA